MFRYLKSSAGDPNIRNIMRIVKKKEDWGPLDRVGPNGNNEVNEEEEEGDIGNIAQDKAIGGNKGKFENSYERGECSNRGGYEEECSVDNWKSTDEEVDPVDGSDRDDSEAIAIKAIARSLRRSTEGLEVPPGFSTPRTESGTKLLQRNIFLDLFLCLLPQRKHQIQLEHPQARGFQ
ncbi:hypothetical protein SLEP1_g20166 [Rubroshorea leprosula]|uniref:Uncharacterized protein n=1 Tax=Rubroshorea leprosula TaxID=152421 RepID=A0AAV5JAZ7_9ROSI|nr:hypothetical protein SLEP1_g20166 [Rubroshorea leprosula]